MKLRALASLVGALTISAGLAKVIDAQAPADATVYAVAYVEVLPDARNQRVQEAHAAAPHTKQYRDKLQPMTGSPLDERLYRSVG